MDILKVGQKVRIMKVGDIGTFDRYDARRLRSFIGKIATIDALITDGMTGDSPLDPLYVVVVDGEKLSDGFWGEELEVIPEEA